MTRPLRMMPAPMARTPTVLPRVRVLPAVPKTTVLPAAAVPRTMVASATLVMAKAARATEYMGFMMMS